MSKFQRKPLMEIQFVHINEDHIHIGSSETHRNFSILSVAVELQKTRNHELDSFFDSMGQLKSKNINKIVTKAKLADFLPRNTDKFYRYTRHDSYPSCNGISIWTVFKVNNSNKPLSVKFNHKPGYKQCHLL